MKGLYKILTLTIVITTIVSCKKDSRPNYQYMPNMYTSVGYETYSKSDAFNNGVEAQLPVEGTVPRGHSLYDYKNTNEGYDLAKAELKNPLTPDMIDAKRGKELYDIYCGICHGNKGKGQGNLVKREKILGIPNYADRDITDGSIYHVIYWGKNSMGSYAGQLNEEERWQVTAYVQSLKEALTK